MSEWESCGFNPPPNDMVVETKIDDGRGVRNIARLRRRGALWFLPDDSMYVYYAPTHWRELESEAGK
jgi:hypothetical protein